MMKNGMEIERRPKMNAGISFGYWSQLLPVNVAKPIANVIPII